ncbi:TPA: hypothetical protein L4C48_001130 [Enterobacter kobei]|nr:hypothetical protein [Enterobacter kobei]HBO1175449.1 hypothetical protein [Enterobacter kobei]HBO2006916.1 hypothetical protein [Enterobacter kobei]HBO2414592.1 hypothetical protein [Enterobacter kobei]
MASKPVQNITRESGFFYALHPLAGISPFLPLKRLSLRAVSSALALSAFSYTELPLKQIVPTAGRCCFTARPKKIFRGPKSHYTAPTCGFWIIEIFQFYFSSNQTAWPRYYWRLCGKPKLKTLKRISVFFHFWKVKIITGYILTD